MTERRELARLDRPQRLGLLPTTAFWQRPDVWRIAGPSTGVFVFLWLMMLSLFVVKWTPMWASALLAGLGPFLFVSVLERYLRRRLRRREALAASGTEALGSADPSRVER
ncbi:hypothetical protein POL58_16765 [Nannocystis sp. ncelm1]|uniref:Uncharacterized protein n=1 Tax=Nannocystis radixulma TaxID=2995305 RepID=A0ABT5B5K3_9BACT|nr:hypothetical protein [Nannocystis radixulma]